MKRVLTAIALIPVVLAAALRAPVPVLAALVAGVAMVTLREYFDIVAHLNIEPFRTPVYVLTAAGLVAIAFQPSNNYLISTANMIFGLSASAVFVAFFLLAIGMRRVSLPAAFPAVAASTFGFLYIAFPLAMLVQLRQQGSGAFLILYVLIVVWMGDTVAYYTGRAFGRHKMAPRISPGKTWEGAAGSMLGAVASGYLVFAYSAPISQWLLTVGLVVPGQGYTPPHLPPLWQFALLSAVINVAAQLGDLAESLLKRGAGVKDSGTLLPGHGGMLDRIDALLFATPVLWYYAAWRVLS